MKTENIGSSPSASGRQMSETRTDISETQAAAHPPAVNGGRQDIPPAPLRSTLRSLARSWWIIVLCGLIALAAGLGVEAHQTKAFSAATYVLLSANNYQQSIAGGYNVTNLQNTEATAAAYLTPGRQNAAAQQAGVRPGSSWSISVVPSATSSVLTVGGTAANPRVASRLADAAANQIIEASNVATETQLSKARSVIRSQAKAAPTRAIRRLLFGQLNNLATLQALSDRSIQILEKAQIPEVSNSAGKTRTGGIALVLGLVVGIAIALLRPDRRFVGAHSGGMTAA